MTSCSQIPPQKTSVRVFNIFTMPQTEYIFPLCCFIVWKQLHKNKQQIISCMSYVTNSIQNNSCFSSANCCVIENSFLDFNHFWKLNWFFSLTLLNFRYLHAYKLLTTNYNPNIRSTSFLGEQGPVKMKDTLFFHSLSCSKYSVLPAEMAESGVGEMGEGWLNIKYWKCFLICILTGCFWSLKQSNKTIQMPMYMRVNRREQRN